MTDFVHCQDKEVVHRVHCINGLPLPLYVTQYQLYFMKEMELFSDDIWVVTCPRSGTTWIQQIVRSILAKGNEDHSIDQAVPYLEAADSKIIPYGVNFSTIERPRVIKSHMSYNSMPCGPPKDRPMFAPWFLSGQVYFGSQLDHVLGWWEQRDDDNVLFLKYEDMKKDFKSAIICIASFIGKDLTEEEVDKVIKKSSFSNMKNNPTTNYE